MTAEAAHDRMPGWFDSVRFSVLLLGLTWFLTACVAPQKYTPAITSTPPTEAVPTSSNPLPFTVRMVKLVDVSPPEDKVDGWLYGSGWSVTSPERLNGDLAVLLTAVAAEDLRSHEMFSELTEDHKSEQIRIGGKIHRFYQRREQYLWTLCCGLLGVLLPFPLMKEEGEVDLELTLSGTDDKIIKSYRVKSSFLKRCSTYESRCWESYNSSPAKYLDQAFGDSLRQIREAIIRDRELIARLIM